MSRFLPLTALLAAFSLSALAQDDVFFPSASYEPSIPTPESVLGYRVGENFTPYHQLERYYQQLAAASERVQLDPYGESVEGRTLYLVIITAPENHSRLDAIRDASARLSDPRATSQEEAERLAASTPVVVWLSYNVHGNESVSSEAALQVAYELAASGEARVADWLAQAVVVLDPIVNPDGRERYVHYYRSTVGRRPNPDRFAAEHQERWPGGRTNHYLFDLNRDWVWQTQPESRARVRAFLRWHPQVHVDYHEMRASSTYFFPPPAEPVHETFRALLAKWYGIYGRANAAAFDRHGFRYYTGEDYDLLYPAYGDTWPALNGAVGMTYEQAGGGFAGLVVELPQGERRLTLHDRAARHFLTSLSTLQASVEHRTERLRDYYEFRRAAIEAGRNGSVRQFFLVPGADRERLARAVEILQRQGIEVQRAEAAFEAEKLTDFRGETLARQQLPAGTYVVDLAQPQGFLARAVLEREAALASTFFYDVTAWSLPLAFGLETYAAAEPAQVALTR
ncbi:MAG: M14 metallopeptidase family protein, partial [Terriglobia bacterium]